MAELNEYNRYLRDEVEHTLTRSKGGLYVCPLCGSGTGEHKTGAFSISEKPSKTGKLLAGEWWQCFACHKYGDIFDLYELRDGLSKADAARAVLARYGNPSPPSRLASSLSAPSSKETGTPATPPRNYTAAIKRFAAALEGSAGQSYLEGRGFTLDTMRRKALGYDATHDTITIPYDKEGTYYGQRAVNPNATRKHNNLYDVDVPLYNPDALYSAPVCFVVESPLCAASIEQEGGAAVAISGTSGDGRLLAQLNKKPTSAVLVLALDNDNAGQTASAALGEKLKGMGVYSLEANIAGEYNDPNERLQHDAAGLRAEIGRLQRDPEGLRAEIAATIEAEQLARDAEKQAEIEAYRGESVAGLIAAFTDGIAASVDTPAIPTGFTGLDNLLEGGLYEGTYYIGAISSLGKTTLALQMADQIAATGQDVIIFSLEMASTELVAKSISRITYKTYEAQGLGRGAAKSTRGISTGKRYAGYSDKEISLIGNATREYATIAKHLWIKEGIGDMGAAQVREAVQKHISLIGQRPVVVIDYIQILAPYDMRATDKQNVDKAVLELKRISRDFKIPIIGISSFNRDNYTAPVNMAAFKESGAIEYSSDVLIGLQYTGMDYEEGEADKAREKRIRELIKANAKAGREGKGQEIDLKVLKNRNGAKDTSDPLTFYPMFNYFAEHPAGFTVVDDAPDVFNGNRKRR